MANRPSPEPLLFGQPTEAEIAIVDEALTAFEVVNRYAAGLESQGPHRDAMFRRAQTAARLLERLANNGPRELDVPA